MKDELIPSDVWLDEHGWIRRYDHLLILLGEVTSIKVEHT
jgi:hypothetical protein